MSGIFEKHGIDFRIVIIILLILTIILLIKEYQHEYAPETFGTEV